MKKITLSTLLLTYFVSFAQSPIHEFTFDGNLSNSNKSVAFQGIGKFTKDRFGVDKKALRVSNESLVANIDNLPQNDSPRTISIWVKFNDITNSNYIWGYGAARNNSYCGLIHQGTSTAESSLNIAAWGFKNDFIIALPLSKEIWYNYTYVYDGKNAAIYRNGILLETFFAPNRQTIGNFFKIGNVNSLVSIDADIDDLKIYNIALSNEAISNQYLSNVPTIIVENNSSIKKSKQEVKKKIPSTKAIVMNK
ncbi:LamG-like jellyroll fold domain-containing protein [Flavobacterium sp. RSSA_27]|uniref:LamG-like jellyroll fold domain-containing protein n=1 Tax=Flavobacterium sp. RSSA_27 TaxID=3447667 RepID=UPI003F315DE3